MSRIITGLMLVLLAALTASPAAAELTQQDVLAWIESLGGSHTSNTAGEVTGVDLRSAWLTDADLEKLARLPQLESINLAYTKITDLALEHLRPLANVRNLNLYYAEQVGDGVLTVLKSWKELRRLNLRGTKITDLGVAQLEEHPALIYCSISAYGQTGPYADRAGVDGIVQADSGLMSLIGMPDSEPCKVQAPVVDVMTGYVACMGILARLAQRTRDGQGGHLDVNLLNAALALQQSSITSYFADGALPVRAGSAAPYSAPNQAFETTDGWIMVAAYTPERWKSLCAVLNLPQLVDDPRFATSPLRVANRLPMVEALTRIVRTRTTAEWLPLLKAADILCAAVATYDDVIRHPQVAANRMISEVRHPELGTIRMPGFPIDSAAANARPSRPAPACGQDTRAVLLEAGYAEEDIEVLQEWGAIHCAEAALEGVQ